MQHPDFRRSPPRTQGCLLVLLLLGAAGVGASGCLSSSAGWIGGTGGSSPMPDGGGSTDSGSGATLGSGGSNSGTGGTVAGSGGSSSGTGGTDGGSSSGSGGSPASTGGSSGSSRPAGTYLVAVDTPTRTYLDYVQLPARGDWDPNVDGWPKLAQWENETRVNAIRFLSFAPGNVVSPSDAQAFLPVTAPAATALVVTAAPYDAATSPADATAAIQQALDDARSMAGPGHPVDVVVPAGSYDYSAVLEVGADVRLRGDQGAVLHALQATTSAVHLAGDRSGALFLSLTSPATSRSGQPDASGIWIGPRNAGDPPVHDVVVVGNQVAQPMGAHIFAIEEIGGIWAFNDAHDGYSDTFHHTGRSSYAQVVANRASGMAMRGDDLYAFVGYAGDGDPVHHCSCIANWGRDGNARGLSAVGAGFITFQDNDVARTEAAGIYVARETSYGTYGSFEISVLRNQIQQANLDNSHDGLLAFSDASDQSTSSLTFGMIPNLIRNLTVTNNSFIDIAAVMGNGFGIEVRSSCQGGQVNGNVVQQATSPGIVVNGADFVVSANTFSAQ